MQRDDAVTIILARIMKMMDRSSESVLSTFSPFEFSDRMIEANTNPLRRELSSRGRNAQSNRDFPGRKLRHLASDNFARIAKDDPLRRGTGLRAGNLIDLA